MPYGEWHPYEKSWMEIMDEKLQKCIAQKLLVRLGCNFAWAFLWVPKYNLLII